MSLDLRARCSKDGLVELEGSPDVLTALARVLRIGEAAVIALQIPQERPDPYERWLESIAVEPELLPQVLIARFGNQLVLRGGRKSLDVLADNVELLAQVAGGETLHTHIEHFPGHYYLREGFVPLVVSLR
jgi:hypothetical protein